MPWIPTRPMAGSSGWSLAAALAALTLLTATEAGLAAPLNQVERFDCGALGQVVLRSGPVRMSRKAGHTVAAARINIAARGINQEGILHSIMGGNDRTFTRRESDDVRSIDDTSAANPVILKLMIGDYFYSKRRQQITISLRNEAYSCIPR